MGVLQQRSNELERDNWQCWAINRLPMGNPEEENTVLQRLQSI
jgi:hypothetical protein